MISKVKLQRIRIKPLGFHYHIKLKINSKTVRMVLDTGASRSVLDLEFARSLKNSSISKNELLSAGIGGTGIDSYTIVIDEFQIGKLKIEKIEMAIIDLVHVNQSYKEAGIPEIKAILGNDILHHCNANINLKTMILTCYHTKTKK
jgi:hypothetical protein